MKLFLKIFVSISLGMFLAFPAMAQDSSADSGDADGVLGTITNITFKGVTTLPLDQVKNIATLKVGDSFTRQKLENSINDLRKWGVFAKVEVLVEYDDSQVSLTYELQEGFIIKAVHIKGNFPVLESKVRQTLFLNPGLIYDSSRLPEQVDRLDQLYEREGYYGTTVLAIEDYDEENHQVSLYFRIKKGTTYRLRKTNVEGNTALNEGRIKAILFTFFHFKPKRLKSDMQKITKIYKRKGFVRARVRVGGELFDYDARKIDLDLVIRQGPRVKVSFEGNHHFFNRTLKKHITIFEDGDFDEFELEASKKKLTRFYLERGFEKVSVTWERKRLNKDYYLITFKIDEGPQRKVSSITFTGNEHFKSKVLKDLMATKEAGALTQGYYFQKLFEQDLSTIEAFYADQGFLNMEIASWDKTYSPWGDRVYLTVNIKEGPRAMVQNLKLEGLPEDEKEKVLQLISLKPDNYYSLVRLNNDIQSILVYLANHGHPYASVSHDVQEPKPNQYDISYTVTEGKPVEIGQILFVGNVKTKERILRQNLTFTEGESFSTQDLLQSQINLRRLNIFDLVAIETLGLTSEREKVNVVVRVMEKKDKILDFEIGYNTDLGWSGKVVFNKLNIFGAGKNTNIKLQVGTEVNRIELNYIDPRLFGSSLQLTLGTYAGREDRPFYRSQSVGGYGSIFKQFSRKWYTFGRLDFSFNDINQTFTVFEKVNPAPIPNAQTRLTTTLGIVYDTRDNFGDPRRGAYLSGTAALTDQFFTLNGNYATLKANLGYWYSPVPRFTIANALRVGQILKLPASTIVPADARFYLGGDNTVRGFDQDALLPSGGLFALVHNLEFQFRIFKNFQLVAFLDSGVVTQSISEVNTTTLRHSAGPSIRYVTPVGPIRLDWGFVLDPEPTDSTSNRVHFSFGYFF